MSFTRTSAVADIRRPILKPHLAVFRAGDAGCFVVDDQSVLALRGAVYAHLAAALDGRRSVGDLVRDLSREFPAEEVYFALDHLEQLGYLTAIHEGGSLSEGGFWSALSLEPAQAREQLDRASVAVTDIRSHEVGSARSALTGAGLRLANADTATVEFVVCDDYLDPRLEEIEKRLCDVSRPWLLVKPAGVEPWIGPLLIPGQTACLECLASRVRAGRHADKVIGRETGLPSPLRRPIVAVQASLELAFCMAAIELARWISGGGQSAIGSGLLTLDLRTLTTQRHAVVRRPQCVRCGDSELIARRGWAAVEIGTRTKVHTLEAGHRDRSPEKTLGDLSRHISPITGVVRELTAINSADDEAVRTYASGPNLAMPSRDWGDLKTSRNNVSGGKGLTDTQARVSAVCEAIERYSSTFHGDEPRRLARMCELGDAAIQPNDFQLFSRRQFRERESLNRESGDRRSYVPAPFDDTVEVEWTPLWSLRDGVQRMLPTACCYLGYGQSENARGVSDFAIGDSNGVAAGNSLEEATLQAFMELVERDAVAIWWYNRLRRPSVDLESFNQPRFETLRESYRRLRRSLWLLDLTSDLRIPTFAAVSVEDGDAGRRSVLLGFGSHFDPVVAASRALSETTQMLRRPSGDGGTSLRPELKAGLAAWEQIDVERHLYLFPAEAQPRRCEDYATAHTDDMAQDLRSCVERVAQRGLDMLVLEQTRPDVGLAVVRVVVPGLRHFWRRFAPGRLYDVPVELGWCDQPTREQDLNPCPMFF
jgi:ribosomal protein S12 methylthiotransferase accessory factor